MRHVCNPVNMEYRYQFYRTVQEEKQGIPYRGFREAADPSMVFFKGKYYMFPSMTGGFFTSEDLTSWDPHPFLQEMPIYDYAPDVHVIGDYIYFCASRYVGACDFYRSKDPVSEPFERIEGSFSFWDPAMFRDDDGRMYLFWGCSNTMPIYGVELEPETMRPLGKKVPLFDSDIAHRGYERMAENHEMQPLSAEEKNAYVDNILVAIPEEQLDEMVKSSGMVMAAFREYLAQGASRPYMEGAWMTKKNGRYYLQYASPSTSDNVYGDSCYVADHPLGPYVPCKNNPYSYKPGGFISGAGHGSTLMTGDGGSWHISSMRVSMNYQFERRLGLWKAGLDEDGGLYCDQKYGDWPMNLDSPLFAKPDWMLLSYGKKTTVSSGTGAEHLTDENIRTWWKAEGNTNEWARLDLGKGYDVRGIQLNFADSDLNRMVPEDAELFRSFNDMRWMDRVVQPTQWKMEGSLDGENWFLLADKWDAKTDLAHDFLTWEEGIQTRFVRVLVRSVPYGQNIALSGIRVFGNSQGEAPKKPEFAAELTSPMDMNVTWKAENAIGVVVSWGYAPDKLWHSYQLYGKDQVHIGALVDGEPVYVSVEAFNENGITQGNIARVR